MRFWSKENKHPPDSYLPNESKRTITLACPECQESWNESPNQITQRLEKQSEKKIICPYCSGRRVGKKNNLKYLYPELLSEWWDYETNNAKGILPENFTKGSDTEETHFNCPKCNHKFPATIDKFFREGTRCPNCKTPKIERYLRTAIKYVFADTKKRETTKEIKEIDILIPSLNIGIEYDGDRFHNDEKDIKRHAEIKREGISLINIREGKLNIINKNSILFKYSIKPEKIQELLKKIFHKMEEILDKKLLDALETNQQRKIEQLCGDPKLIKEIIKEISLKSTLTSSQEIIKIYKQGEKINNILKAFNISRSYLNTTLSTYNIPLRRTT